LKRKTKHKGLPSTGSDSEEDSDGDSTGILGQRAARRAAAVHPGPALPTEALPESETESDSDRQPEPSTPIRQPSTPIRPLTPRALTPLTPLNNHPSTPPTNLAPLPPPPQLIPHPTAPLPRPPHYTAARRHISMSPIKSPAPLPNGYRAPPPDNDGEDEVDHDRPATAVTGKRGRGGNRLGGRGTTSKRRRY